MSAEQEIEFLTPWLASAQAGGMLVVSPTDKSVGDVSAFGPIRMAQGGSRHRAPQKRHIRPSRLEKKLPEKLATLLTPEAAQGRKVRLMFQDEARFGRMVRIRRCWGPTPLRSVVSNGYEREFVYVYGAIRPIEGELDWMICPKMNTDRMGEFLFQIHTCHPDEFIVKVTDGASSHVFKELRSIVSCACLPTPPDSTSKKSFWDELQEKNFPNRVFATADFCPDVKDRRIG